MNAEIVQSPAVSGADPGPEAPSQSAAGSLIGVFTEPRRTFAAMTQKPRLLAPMIVLVLFQLLFGLLLAQSGVMKNDAIAKMEAKNAPQEQLDAVTRMMDSPARFVFAVAGPIVLVFSLLISAALLYFMANLMLGGRLRYAHYLCIAAYGAVVGIVDQAVRLGLALNRGTLQVHLGVGAFLGDDLSAPLRILDTATDPLLLWAVVVQAVGVAAMAKKGFGFGLLAVLPGTLILVCLSAFQR
jgi:hypothetical protein